MIRSRPARAPAPPGAVKRRFRPKFHYELIACGVRGHVLVGTDAESVRPVDSASSANTAACAGTDACAATPGCRCRRPCGSGRQFLGSKRDRPAACAGGPPEQVRPAVIAIDRALHFLVLGSLAVLAFVLASHRERIARLVDRLNMFFFGTGKGTSAHPHGFTHEVEHLLTLNVTTFRLIGAAAAAYAILEGAEAYGLAPAALGGVPDLRRDDAVRSLEVYDLVDKITAIRVGAFAVNLAILFYLLLAKRLFGLRGGAAADEAAAKPTPAGRPSNS